MPNLDRQKIFGVSEVGEATGNKLLARGEDASNLVMDARGGRAILTGR